MNDLAQKYVRMCSESEFDHEFDQQLANLRAVLAAGADANFTTKRKTHFDDVVGMLQDPPQRTCSALEHVAHSCPVQMRGLFAPARPAYENLLLLMRVMFDAGARVQPNCLARIPRNARAHREILKLLLAAGAEIDAVSTLHLHGGPTDYTFLSLAVFYSRVDLVELALELGADAVDAYYPLMWTFKKLDSESLMSGVTFNIARALLVYGADPDKHGVRRVERNGKSRLLAQRPPFIPMWREYIRRRREQNTYDADTEYLTDIVALVAARNAHERRYTTPRPKDVPELAARVAHYTKDLAQRRFALLRARALDLCTALHPLNLSAHETVAILDQAIKLMPLVPLHMKWSLVTTVKHFHQRAAEAEKLASNSMPQTTDDVVVPNSKAARTE